MRYPTYEEEAAIDKAVLERPEFEGMYIYWIRQQMGVEV